MINRADIKPGLVFDWPHTPDFSVFSRLVVDRLDGHRLDYAWCHHQDTGTVNGLSVTAICQTARVAPEEDTSEHTLWWFLALMVMVVLAICLYYVKR